ncbi:hypothetical protein [Parachlamydia sp. AcF125]|uniref:hypothetical protein n=1 Tax=Parachlamydia sp. AcF125 TaxID=2795736 RepID=UPI001BC925CB|nr:hypothetical protein [Parachlamydia sp. AcF125]MBS4168428.1 hypothetical protein [Parachlamydia sp. AcF125]
MSIPKQSKKSPNAEVRISLVCSAEQRKKIRMLAAQEDKSMNEFLLSLVEEKEKRCPLCETYGPNELTIKTMKESDKGENLERYKNNDEFWEAMGLDNVDTDKH